MEHNSTQWFDVLEHNDATPYEYVTVHTDTCDLLVLKRHDRYTTGDALLALLLGQGTLYLV